MVHAFDYISPKQLKSAKRTGGNKYIVRRKTAKKTAPKTAKSPPKTSKKSAPKTAKSPPKTGVKSRAMSARRGVRRTPGKSYRKKTAAKKHGSLRSYLKGKDMMSKLSPVMESPNRQISPETKRLRRLGFYGNLPRTPKIKSKSNR